MIMSLEQRKIKFEPRIKLNHNTDIILSLRLCDVRFEGKQRKLRVDY